jgi:hypothetical protein
MKRPSTMKLTQCQGRMSQCHKLSKKECIHHEASPHFDTDGFCTSKFFDRVMPKHVRSFDLSGDRSIRIVLQNTVFDKKIHHWDLFFRYTSKPCNTMPKVYQSRRHSYRKNNSKSPALTECVADSIALNRTAPRKVSEEDINSCTGEETVSSDEDLYPLRRRGHLKRPIPSACLVDLASATTPLSRGDSSAESRLSPITTFPEESGRSQDVFSPSSPWGHFVDLLITSNISDYEAFDFSGDSSSSRSFLPSHYSPDTPYAPTKKTKRRRLYSPARPVPLAHKQQSGELPSEYSGFILTSTFPSSSSMLDANLHNAFEELRF